MSLAYRKALALVVVAHLIAALMVAPPWVVTLQAAYSHIVNASGGNDGVDLTIATTNSVTTTGADFLVACVSVYVGSAEESSATFTDSKSNTWSTAPPTARQDVGPFNRIKMYYSRPTSVGTSHTFTYDNANNVFPSVTVQAFSGSVASPYDVESAGASGTSSTIQPGSATPSESNELMVTCVSDYDANGAAIDSSFSTPLEVNWVSGGAMGLHQSYKIKTDATSENPQWSSLPASLNVAMMATFKDTAGGGGGGGCTGGLLLLGVGKC